MPEVLSQIAEILVAATIVLIPLVTTSGGIDNFREPKDSLFIAAAALLVVVGALRFAFRPEKMSLKGGPGRPPLLFLAALGWTFLSAAFATNRHDTVAPLVWVGALAVFAFAATMLAQREGTITVLWALVAPLINAAVYLLQRFHIWNPIRFTADVPDHFRYTALIGNPDDASSFFVAPVIAALALVLVTRGWRRWAAATAFAVLSAAVITGRLTSIIAVGAGLLTLAIVREHKRALPVIAAAILAVVIAGLAYAPLRSRLQLVIGQFRAGDYAEATSGRITPFLAAVEMAGAHPLFGVGPNCFGWEYFPYKIAVERQHPQLAHAYAHIFNFSAVHNDHLQLIAECGIVAYVLLLLAIISVVARAQRTAGDDDRAAFARTAALPLAVALAVLCLAHFPLHLTAPVLMFVYLGALVYGWSDESPRIEELRLLRAAGAFCAVLAIAGSVWIALHFAYDPFVAEGKKLQLKARTEQVLAMGDPYRTAPIARENLAKIGENLPKRPGDIDYLMLRAANDRVLGNYEDARDSYLEALRYDRRPELYAELGVTELQMGRRQEALDALYQAVLFSRVYLDSLSPDVVDELKARLRREAPYLDVH
ncbi:MAG TPA: O-antigen ligase family protein [Thermoanaerobaculia bacterium]|jgi:O-antigen ligase|nr:O-antigen ligase family protein [Thermoanaerobaculia bacterium]